MQHDEILAWLRETDPVALGDLWQLADQTRQKYVGGQVHLRGLLEISSHCVRLCGYCGLRAGNLSLKRYRMLDDEILDCAAKAVEFGYGTVVLQAGEDPELTETRVSDLIRRIKNLAPLAVTLSLGERSEGELAAWREAGADRYLLRFETSNPALLEKIHPPRSTGEPQRPGTGPFFGEKSHFARKQLAENMDLSPLLHQGESPIFADAKIGTVPAWPTPRMAMLPALRRLGYEVGGGVMIGIPGQTYDDLADDIEWFARLNLDMIGVGPYLRHPETPLADRLAWPDAPDGAQVPATELMTYKVIALARLACPKANIPATTALATINRSDGRELGLVRGANVVMPNLTPPKYRALYEIYPGKACLNESGEQCHRCLTGRLAAIGREPGQGRGDSPNFTSRGTF